MITDHEVERALDFLRDNASEAAEARAKRLYLEQWLKALKSQIMKEHAGEPVSAQEREAYADDRYTAALEGYRQAVHEDERLRFLRSAAEVKCEAWRTMCSNQRAMGKII